jgi:serine phosphatase RsbU (regulator of sigma subunit)/anti-sigma regulatory factor (Ser/Thr protein kinase)
MTTFTRLFRRHKQAGEEAVATDAAPKVDTVPVAIDPADPLVAYFQNVNGAVELDSLELDSPARQSLQEAGMKLVVPLVSQGELIGLLNLGPRLSERDYSADDRKLLDNLASHAAPAVRVAQLVRQQEAEVLTRERLEQELRVAQLIQQQFLPKELPELSGWNVSAYYQPARAVGGDFYDFIELPDGQIGIVVGDVTDKGVPAALVMATTHSILRGDAPRLVSPAKVLKRANDRLYPDIPSHMFVTCLYAVLNPSTGRLTFANAGHNLPYVRTDDGVIELRATGMPLGLMPDMEYEESEATLEAGSNVLLHSDGLAEAHARDGEMFGFPRLQELMGKAEGGNPLIDLLLENLSGFTGQGWEQEDDITLVTIQRSGSSSGSPSSEGRPVSVTSARTDDTSVATDDSGRASAPRGRADDEQEDVEVLAEFSIPSEEGKERLVMEKVADAVSSLNMSSSWVQRLQTAVSEATMNAIEHGNESKPELDVAICVLKASDRLRVRITDHGGGQEEIPEAQTPDIEAKLAGEQTPRGWGLFLIKNMVDDMEVTKDEAHHTIELILDLKGNADAS